MILADKITEERKRCGMSQEELAEKLGVSRQAVSKWESAQTMPDIDKILRLAELFGVTTDYLLKDDAEPAERPRAAVAESDSALRRVSLEEANAYMDDREKASVSVASGVAACIVSPAVLILLFGISEQAGSRLSAGTAAAVGLTVLFACVAWAVFRFIRSGSESARFEYLEKEAFETAYGVTGVVRERASAYRETYNRGLSVGVALCIFAALPLCAISVFGVAESVLTGLVSLLLVIVAAGVYAIVRVSVVKSSFDRLLEEGDYTRRNKRLHEKNEAVGGVYWTLVTAGYLAWSFITNEWHRTWIVWPVAAVLFGMLGSVLRLTEKDPDR